MPQPDAESSTRYKPRTSPNGFYVNVLKVAYGTDNIQLFDHTVRGYRDAD